MERETGVYVVKGLRLLLLLVAGLKGKGVKCPRRCLLFLTRLAGVVKLADEDSNGVAAVCTFLTELVRELNGTRVRGLDAVDDNACVSSFCLSVAIFFFLFPTQHIRTLPRKKKRPYFP